MAWQSERITDPQLRAWTNELRTGKPNWITIGEAARRKGVTITAINQWINRRYLPAVRYGNWWLREDVVAAFVLPCDAPPPALPIDTARRYKGVTVTKIERPTHAKT